MNFDFNERHIVITGGAGTLGSAVVELLLCNNAKCSVPCYSQSEQESFSLSDHQNVYTQAGIDLTDEDQTQAFYDEAITKQGALWGSIHIAGGFRMGNIEDTPLSDFSKQIQLNTFTCYNACRTAIRLFRKSGYSGGRIVNIASRPAVEPRQGNGMTAYTVSKAGVAALTESLAAEVVQDNILVNAVAPSIIDTPKNREDMPEANYDNWPKPQQLANQIIYLVSKENEVTRGGIVPVYGKS